ncbi:MAG: Ribosomal RNA small subunit methyltransferase A [Parcubacteria group bacterium GW2011_GWC1_45_14]|nr:MAG: Ribosomal RNA small subunit methyltransferase A [Parcubacteria group bacterium GW2011_GWC1_45_14]
MDIKPKKSLGQNFLKDEKIINQIIESANLSIDDIVIEVGPGEGVLTEKLPENCKKVIAVELDDRLIGTLKKKFEKNANVEIVHGDILKINFSELATNYVLQTTNYKVVANLPYYITSPILRYFLENELPPKEMIVMVQKEVAQRIVAKPGQMSILAVSVQYYAEAEYLFTVKRDSFEPAPKVDSAVIRIKTLKQESIKTKEETKDFFRIVKAGFSAKRKTLANNLANSLHKDKKEIENIISEMGFLPTVRAQELSVEDWKRLMKVIG